MTLRELLYTCMDVKLEVNIYKNWTYSPDKETECVKTVEGDTTTLAVNFSLKRYGDFDYEKLNVFYIGYKNKGQTLRVNCEVKE